MPGRKLFEANHHRDIKVFTLVNQWLALTFLQATCPWCVFGSCCVSSSCLSHGLRFKLFWVVIVKKSYKVVIVKKSYKNQSVL